MANYLCVVKDMANHWTNTVLLLDETAYRYSEGLKLFMGRVPHPFYDKLPLEKNNFIFIFFFCKTKIKCGSSTPPSNFSGGL